MSEQKIRQNVKTNLACPKPGCSGRLPIMTRKADGRRFLACSAWYGDTHCDYTSNEIPQHLLMQEAGATPLPGFER
jgi:hypothetical protein